MSEKARVLLIVAVILGLALAVSSWLGAEECPPSKPIKEIEVVTEVPEDFLRFIVENGGIILNDEKPFLHIDAMSERVEEYAVIDPEGNPRLLVGVFAKVFVGNSMDAMEFKGCQFIAKREEKEVMQNDT